MPDASSTPVIDSNPAAGADEIYVGYLPVPPRHRRFLRAIVPVLLAMLTAIAVLAARSQYSPGHGRWDTAHHQQLRGVLVMRPYPMLLAIGADSAPELVLLVEQGKHGPRRAEFLEGRAVLASGSTLERDGRRMLELDAGESGLVLDPDGRAAGPTPAPRPMGRITLTGEIIDPKCYLGAMKPGQGKTHKECATLCIRGGIPPMFVTRDPVGRAVYYLLQSPAGGPAGADLHPFIADPIELTGEWSTFGGMNLLSVSPADVKRR